MSPITISAFVSQSGSTAGGPGSSVGNIVIQGSRGAGGMAGPNDSLLSNPSNGNIQLVLQGVVAALLAELPGGAPVQIVIQSPPAAATPAPATASP